MVTKVGGVGGSYPLCALENSCPVAMHTLIYGFLFHALFVQYSYTVSFQDTISL